MNFEIPISLFNTTRGKVIENGPMGTVFCCPPEGLELHISAKEKMFADSGLVEGIKYLVLEAEVLVDHSLTFYFDFLKQNSQEIYDLRVTLGMLPMVNTVVPIDLSILNSQTLFPEQTDGRLKMVVFGKPITINEIDCLKILTAPSFHEHQVRIKSIYLTDTMPKYSLPTIKLMDELGQWIPKEWTGKVKNREACNELLQGLLKEAENFDNRYDNLDWDSYGGWKKKSFEATGWFHTEFDGNRWWLADPEGNAFFSLGIDCVGPETESHIDVMKEFYSWLPPKEGKYSSSWVNPNNSNKECVNFGEVNLIAAFGQENWWECWAKIVKMYLIKWGVNTIGNWSQYEFIKFAKIPYVLPLDDYSEVYFPTTEHKIFRDFPDVFAAEYSINAEKFSLTLNKFKDDPYMIGYFMRNEPEWAFVYGLNIAEEMLANPQISESKTVFINRMSKKYENIETFNNAWNLQLDNFDGLNTKLYHACSLSEQAKQDLEDFSKAMITLYVEVPAKKCKEVDKNHLNLGMRYAFITDPILLSGYENFDVFSINSYQTNPYSQISGIGELLDMPVMIGEFHHGALDRGLTATGIRGVTNQEQRGVAYHYYVEQGIRSPYFLGAHYFMFNDQSSLGRSDGENYQIGLVDICMQEYQEMAMEMKKCHNTIYEVCNGEKEIFNTVPAEIPSIHY